MQILVKVHANSKKSGLIKRTDFGLEVYVREPALEGKANEAVKDALARHFGVKRYQVRLVRGQKSKVKMFEFLV